MLAAVVGVDILNPEPLVVLAAAVTAEHILAVRLLLVAQILVVAVVVLVFTNIQAAQAAQAS